MTDIDVGAISEALNNKADRDLVNSTPPYLKTAYGKKSGISGYNIWSNGYCEQWSYANATTISLFKTYRDTEYTVYLTKWTTNASDNAVANVTGKSTSSFSCASGWNSGSGSFSGFWKTCGYLAEGQY